jgi:hypothetical protein
MVFAPTKAHVTMPIVGERLSAEKVRAFMALRNDSPLLEPDVLLASLLERAEARESVVAEWCAREGISFVAVTDALREAAISGRQVYFTYDQHWTPDGHEVVAEVLAGHLRKDSGLGEPTAEEPGGCLP